MPSNTSIKRPKASSSNISAGAITQIRKTPQGVILKLKNGTARLSFYSPEVLRVEVELSDKITESHSYAVVSKPGSVAFELEEKRGGWLLKSKALHVEITKKAFRLCMKTPEGKVLNADDPAFGSAWQGTSCTTYKTLQPEERFIGLGEKSGGVDLKGSAWYNWNTDAFAYGPGTDPLYCSTPFYMGIHAAGSYGIFFDNSHKSRFNFGASGNRFSFFNAEDGPMNYYFFSGSVEDIVKQYSKLTGKMPMPPKWALGFQQCRYSYYPDLQIHNKAITFRQRDIPADVLYLDIHYMDKYKVFSWDEDRFPDPEKLMSSLEAMGFKVVVIVDPGVKVEKGYKPYDSGIKNDHFVPYPDGTYYQGDVWPGTCHFPDYTNPKTRKWWSKQVKEFVKCGIAGVWNDMNEPATWGQDMPDLMEFDFEGEGGTHKKARNIYGQNMARATREGLGDKNTRPFVLTRAGYAGIQRYAAVWTGDNVASDEHMLLGARMLANMGISGMPFTGYDVGGFVGESDPQLYSRWISLGAFSPFFRGHSMINTRSSEPWAYGEEAEANAKNYINLRYKLLPYIYAQFREAALTGIPVVRSMTLNWADDSRIYDEEFMNQYLFGPSLLVCPKSSKEVMGKILLPSGNWFYLYDDEQFEAGVHYMETPVDRLPVLVKAGAVLAMQSLVQYTSQDHDGVLRLHVYAGANGEFELYEDDGESYDYKKKGFSSRLISHDGTARSLHISEAKGSFESSYSKLRIYFHGYGQDLKVNSGRSKLKCKSANYNFIDQLPNFDPFGYVPDDKKQIDNLPFLETSLSTEKQELSW